MFAALLLLLGIPTMLRAAEPPDATVKAASEAAPSTSPAVAAGAARVAAPAAAPVPPVVAAFAGPQLLIQDLQTGVGQEAVTGSLVAVHYTGWLLDPRAPSGKGRQFDSSRGRRALVFPLGGGRVIKGWDLGVVGMKVGGLRLLTIPPELGYGSRPVGGGLIPANSTLIFEVELLGVESVTETRGVR